VIPRVAEILGQQTNESTNSILSFTGVKVDEGLANGRQGVYTFRICGQVVDSVMALDSLCEFLVILKGNGFFFHGLL
jgi:hypothetical protein